MSTSNNYEDREKPVICVCESGDAVGITTRTLYDDASLMFWRAVHSGRMRHEPSATEAIDGILVKPVRVFVLRRHSPEHVLLAKRCRVEKACFVLPDGYDLNKSAEAFEEATAGILGTRLRVADIAHELELK